MTSTKDLLVDGMSDVIGVLVAPDGAIGRKGGWWARKVIHLAACKAWMEETKTVGLDVAMLNRLISLDIVQDMTEHFPERNGEEVIRELLGDCQLVADQAMSAYEGNLLARVVVAKAATPN